jgi:hypothetical protein
LPTGERYFSDLPPEARRDLLRMLESDDHVRADVIRQFFERGDQGMVDVLAELEEDDLLRYKTIEELRRSISSTE